MKWQIVASSSKQEIYELWNNDKKLLTLEFHPATNSARINYAEEKRVFLIRKEGFLKNKTVLCNEYGIRLGQLVHENKENFIELNHERFFYAFQESPKAQVIIYKESKENPIVVCGLNIIDPAKFIQIPKNKIFPITALSSLLLALSWYMFLPVAKSEAIEYAV
ncbi:MAG: hypothetical protein ABUL41_02225 [Chitinophagaceae bacterium]